MTMRYCTLDGNFYKPDDYARSGGAVLLKNSNLNIYGVTTFSNNVAENGGAICAEDFSNITVIGEAIFLYNKADIFYFVPTTSGLGGAAAVFSPSTMTILGKATFLYNLAYYGGAVHVTGLLNIIGEVDFSGNVASEHGGAISNLYSGSDMILGGRLRFFNNTAGGNGGAVNFGRAGYLAVTPGEGGVNFTSNFARGDGGAIAFEQAAGLSFGDGSIRFSNNTCTGSGGAIALLTSSYLQAIDEAKLVFVNNTASESGGAIYAISIGNVNMNGAEFRSNEARMGGAVAIYSSGGGYSSSFASIGVWRIDAGLTDLTFQGNTASEDGGAVLVSGGTLDLGHCFFEGNAAGTESHARRTGHRRVR